MMERIIDFLSRLSENNNRVWFNEHKDEYLECKSMFEDFTAQLIEGIHSFDDSIGQLKPTDCTYRIYRDTRFSQDKTPYKIHMGAFVVPGGKKSGLSGYYLQVGAKDKGFPGGCMLATGDYICDSRVLKLLREDIALDEGQEFKAALDAAKGFDLDWDASLKRVPAGFPADQPYSDWLRLKNFCLVKQPGHKYMTSSRLLDNAIKDFKSTKPFLDFLNRAISYSNE